MSGGYFNYDQNRIGYIADKIEELIATNDSIEEDDWGCYKGHHYTQETIEKFKEAVTTLRKAEVMAQRVDWLVSCDDGEDSFHRRWQEDLRNKYVYYGDCPFNIYKYCENCMKTVPTKKYNDEIFVCVDCGQLTKPF